MSKINKKIMKYFQVYKCRCLLTGELYALKEIPKSAFSNHLFMYSHLNEPNILRRINKYDLGIKLIGSFKDYENIYLITTLFEGKTLDYFKDEILGEDKIKFISACIIQNFIYFRKENIIHRDIGFENIIMDENNFNIIDFSCSIDYNSKNNLKYYIITDVRVIAPERKRYKTYVFNSDYYGFGSLLYYLLFKKFPNVIKRKKHISNLAIKYTRNLNYSSDCIDFINKLIIDNPQKRIGYKDVNELKTHQWFKGFNWDKLKKKLIKSPFKFINDSFKKTNCSKFEKSDLMINTYKINANILEFKEMLKNYDFVDLNII